MTVVSWEIENHNSIGFTKIKKNFNAKESLLPKKSIKGFPFEYLTILAKGFEKSENTSAVTHPLFHAASEPPEDLFRTKRSWGFQKKSNKCETCRRFVQELLTKLLLRIREHLVRLLVWEKI